MALGVRLTIILYTLSKLHSTPESMMFNSSILFKQNEAFYQAKYLRPIERAIRTKSAINLRADIGN